MKTKFLIPVVLFATFLMSCSSDDSNPTTTPPDNNEPEVPVLSSAKSITSFKILGISASINETALTITLNIPSNSDLTMQSPEIEISPAATVSPASNTEQDFTDPVLYTVTAEDGSQVSYTATVTAGDCADESNITTFMHDGKTYEIIEENKTWSAAASCAVERGGFLAEINDQAEQDAIFDALENANINVFNTTAGDGGGASYVWIGGNDIATEGTWILDGDNDGQGAQFWMGDLNGNPVGGLYNNWGMEPDDFGSGQDALGLALTDWPLGLAGQWNDLDENNGLYYVVEFD